jgi:hypothetical protein
MVHVQKSIFADQATVCNITPFTRTSRTSRGLLSYLSLD